MVKDDELGCSATATFPDGSVQTVAGVGLITFVVVPREISVTGHSTASYPFYNSLSGSVGLRSAETGSGITFNYTIGPPPAEFSSEGDGAVATSQVLTGSAIATGSDPHNYSTGSQWDLDTQPIYDGAGWQDANGSTSYSTDDTPQDGCDWSHGETATLDFEMSFQMHDIYDPPDNGVGWITTSLCELPWAWNCSAYFDAAGDIPPAGAGPTYSSWVDDDWANFQWYNVMSGE